MYFFPKDIYMRKAGDYRPAVEIKQELVKEWKDRIFMVFEDNTKVVQMWRDMGITCLQVADGEL